MIDNEAEIFLVPDTLATDVKAYWAKKERKLKSPVKDVSEKPILAHLKKKKNVYWKIYIIM